jgi:hypothetical protein
MGANPRNLRELDVDVGESGRAAAHARPGWSIAGFGVPLYTVGLLLGQTVLGTLYMEHRFGRLESSVDRFTEDRRELYKQGDATRDLARRDDQIEELKRRLAAVEANQVGRGR